MPEAKQMDGVFIPDTVRRVEEHLKVQAQKEVQQEQVNIKGVVLPHPDALAAASKPPEKRVAVSHPVLSALKKDLGISSDLVTVTSLGHTWKMRALPSREAGTASGLMRKIGYKSKGTTTLEYNVMLSACLVAASVVEIDDVPVYTVFSLSDDLHIPFQEVPADIKFDAGCELAKFLVDESKSELLNDLLEAYSTKVDKSKELTDIIDGSVEVWNCTIDGCDVTYREKPGEHDKLFCKVHSAPMQKATSDPLP